MFYIKPDRLVSSVHGVFNISMAVDLTPALANAGAFVAELSSEGSDFPPIGQI